MKKLIDNAKKWKIPTVNGLLITGYFEEWRYRDSEVTESDNCIFTAYIKPYRYARGRSSVTFMFTDEDDGNVYHTGAKGMMEITKAIADGTIGVEENGYLSGVFTFKKQGENIYLFPYERE
jgi:hypothetical protein